MIQVALYSGCLISGMVVSQLLDATRAQTALTAATMICLAYIMIEVGLEFVLDKQRLASYGIDYLVAATAAAFPWLLCAAYFMAVFQTDWRSALLIGRFAAPTSAGVLFALLAAAGLGTTWLFRKARVLAIFDDLDTVLLMIPLQMLFIGLRAEMLITAALIVLMLVAAYRYLHILRWPTSKIWLLGYGALIVAVCRAIEHTIHIHIEVLLPAFALGCILFNPHDPSRPQQHPHEHQYLEPDRGMPLLLDRLIKTAFMFLVGCSLPRIELGQMHWTAALWHTVALTVLANLGKCFPTVCYRREAPLRHRVALSIAMFPRGEVGAGVLLVALSYGLGGLPVTLAGISLALNLLLTGVFIAAVKHLIDART